MTDPTMDLLDVGEWAPAKTFDDFALGCCRQPHLHLLTDPDRFSLIRRAGRMGPLALSEFLVGADVSMGGEQCSTYRVIVVQSGHMESVHRGLAVSAGPGTAVVYPPDGAGAARWAAGSNIISFKIDRCAVEDVLSDALGRQATSGVEFTPVMPMTAAATHGWMRMLLLFREQLFRQGSVLRQPMVGLPFADSLVRAFLLAADHSNRHALLREEQLAAPRTVRAAVEILEGEAQLPLTISSLAARCHVSVRSLQDGFRRHLGVSPMTYLREVRLRRAHESLLASDPSATSVASVAYQWGFTNLGRFAAAHTARYDEPPAVTLQRRAFRRSNADLRSAR